MKTLSALKLLKEKTRAEVFIVGGFVRDLILKKEVNDIDVVVKGISVEEIKNFLKTYGKIKTVDLSERSNGFDVSILLFKGEDKKEAQISSVRGNINNDLQKDAGHRDFTINSLYLPIDKIEEKHVIDFVNGKRDLSNKIIKATGNPCKRIKESPIRILRAVSLSARTGFSIDDELVKAIKSNVKLLNEIPEETIKIELNKIIMSDKPSEYFKMMLDFGILETILPEIYACVGCTQNPIHHKFNVFEHCIYSVDNIEKNIVLRYAALLHDIGKPQTRKEEDGNITFHNHEVIGAKIAVCLLQRLGFSIKFVKEVEHLILHHMYYYTEDWKDPALRRFIRKVGINESNINDLDSLPLFKLRAAERLGNGLKQNPVTDKQIDFQNRLIKVFKESNCFEISDLEINGDVIIKEFSIKQGKIVGEILKFLLNKVLENPKLNERQELIKITAEYIKEEKVNK